MLAAPKIASALAQNAPNLHPGRKCKGRESLLSFAKKRWQFNPQKGSHTGGRKLPPEHLNLCFQRIESLTSVPAGLLIILRLSKNSQRGPTRPIIWSLLQPTSPSLPQPYHVLFIQIHNSRSPRAPLECLLHRMSFGLTESPSTPDLSFSLLTSTYLPVGFCFFNVLS